MLQFEKFCNFRNMDFGVALHGIYLCFNDLDLYFFFYTIYVGMFG